LFRFGLGPVAEAASPASNDRSGQDAKGHPLGHLCIFSSALVSVWASSCYAKTFAMRAKRGQTGTERGSRGSRGIMWDHEQAKLTFEVLLAEVSGSRLQKRRAGCLRLYANDLFRQSAPVFVELHLATQPEDSIAYETHQRDSFFLRRPLE
jgi:hypothetical protein